MNMINKGLATKEIVKEYAWSALITFTTAFCVAIAPTVGSLPVEKSAIFALFAVGIRAGAAALINLVATGFKTISSK